VVFPHRSGPQEQTIGLPVGEWLVDWPGSDKLERLEIKPGARSSWRSPPRPAHASSRPTAASWCLACESDASASAKLDRYLGIGATKL
jgi:hypothetical protein